MVSEEQSLKTARTPSYRDEGGSRSRSDEVVSLASLRRRRREAGVRPHRPSAKTLRDRLDAVVAAEV